MSKESDLLAFAALVHFFQHDDFPTGGVPGDTESGTWNINPKTLRDALAALGPFFTDTDDAVAAIVATYAANHNPDGSHAPPVEWIPEAAAPTFLAAQQFSLVGNRTADYRVGDALRLHQGSGGTTLVGVAITGVTFESGPNRTVIAVRTAANTNPVASNLVSVDRSLVRESARRMGGFDLIDNAINEARILLDGVVTLAKLAPNAVDAERLVDGSVTTPKLAPGAVTGPKLGAEAVQSAHIGALQVLGSHLALGSVGPTRLATNAVQESHIADSQVRSRHIAALNVTGDHLAIDAVQTYAIANAAVVESKLANGAVTPVKLAPEAYQTPSGNTTVTVRRQSGWHYIAVGAAGGDKVWSKAITFPTPFATLRDIRLQCQGLKRSVGAPTTPFDVDQALATNGEKFLAMQPQAGTTSLAGFTAVAATNLPTDNIENNDYIVFTWEAVGT